MSRTNIPLLLCIAAVYGALCSAQVTTRQTQYRVLWEKEFEEPPNLYTPESAVVDGENTLWIMCEARIAAKGYNQQDRVKVLFRISADGQASRWQPVRTLDLPTDSYGTYHYDLAALGSRGVGILFNRIRYELRGVSFLGGYYATAVANGDVTNPQRIGDAGTDYRDLRPSTNGSFYVIGDGPLTVLHFDRTGTLQWKKSYPAQVRLSTASLTNGNLCVASWLVGDRFGHSLHITDLRQDGVVIHEVDLVAHRGAVAPGPNGSCVLLYNREGSREFEITAFDGQLFGRMWTRPVTPLGNVDLPIQFNPSRQGYIATAGGLVAQLSLSGETMWVGNVVTGAVAGLIATSSPADGLFVISHRLGHGGGFHVVRAAIAE